MLIAQPVGNTENSSVLMHVLNLRALANEISEVDTETKILHVAETLQSQISF